MANRTQRLLLWCAATDATFGLARLGERQVLMGRCIHCKRKLAVELDGRPIANETVEHIIPRNHGGGDQLDNLAIACSRCNQGKGARLDPRKFEDETLQRVIATLQARRARRMRSPLAGLNLPPYPSPTPDLDGSETAASPADPTSTRPSEHPRRKRRSRAASRKRKREGS